MEMVESMDFSLVPSEKLKTQEDTSISAKKKGRVKELQNLKFNVNFKDSEFRRELSIPNEDNDIKCERK